jgi:hypothetical protein
MDARGRREPLHFRVWLLLIFGTLIGGGLAIERTGQGEYFEAALAGLVCLTCLGGIGWACSTVSERQRT